MSDPEPRRQPGITPDQHARLAGADAGARVHAAGTGPMTCTPPVPVPSLSGAQAAAIPAQADEPEAGP